MIKKVKQNDLDSFHTIMMINVQPAISVQNHNIMHVTAKFKTKGVLTLLHSERPKLHTILAFLSATGLKEYRKAIVQPYINVNSILNIKLFASA